MEKRKREIYPNFENSVIIYLLCASLLPWFKEGRKKSGRGKEQTIARSSSTWFPRATRKLVFAPSPPRRVKGRKKKKEKEWSSHGLRLTGKEGKKKKKKGKKESLSFSVNPPPFLLSEIRRTEKKRRGKKK